MYRLVPFWEDSSLDCKEDWATAEELLTFEHEIFVIPRERLKKNICHVSKSKSAVGERTDFVFFYGVYFSWEMKGLGLFCISLLSHRAL